MIDTTRELLGDAAKSIRHGPVPPSRREAIATVVMSAVGLSSWGVALMLFVGVASLLVAHRLWSAHETTMSEDIQRQLR